MKSLDSVEEERSAVYRVMESMFGLPLNDGWIMELNKRTWSQDGVPITRIADIWNYSRESILRCRRFYEEKIRHRFGRFLVLPPFRKWQDLIDPQDSKSFSLDYYWLVLVEHGTMSLTEALRIESELSR